MCLKSYRTDSSLSGSKYRFWGLTPGYLEPTRTQADPKYSLSLTKPPERQCLETPGLSMKAGQRLWEGPLPSWLVHPSPELLGSCPSPHLPGYRVSRRDEGVGGARMATPHGWSMTSLQRTGCKYLETRGSRSVEDKEVLALGLRGFMDPKLWRQSVSLTTHPSVQFTLSLPPHLSRKDV